MLKFIQLHWKRIVMIAVLLICVGYFGYGLLLNVHKSPGQYVDDKGKDRELAAALAAAPEGKSFAIDHVVDGDTFVVKVDGGKATIRLLGMNTPETVDPRKPVQCYGPEASARAHQLLDKGTITLVPDSSQSGLDKYGRVLAYAELRDGTLYNKEMILEGYAFEYTYKTSYQYQKDFRTAQKSAKTKLLGLWTKTTCGGKLVPGT